MALKLPEFVAGVTVRYLHEMVRRSVIMRLALKISFVCYLLIVAALAYTGIRYLLASEIMSYHLAAMGSSWDDLSPGAKVMTLCFMKSAAAGFVASSISVLFLLMFPFRKGERWAIWAIPAVVLSELIIVIACQYYIIINTPGRPDIISTGALAVIAALSFILSMWGIRKGVSEKNNMNTGG